MQMHIEKMTLKDPAEKMKSLNIATLVTLSEDGSLAARPISNNGDVDFDGKSYYFTYEQPYKVKQIAHNPQVQLAFEGDHHLYISVAGKAELSRNKADFEKHWVSELGQWFLQGTDTPGMALICVNAKSARYWQDMKMGEQQA